MEFAEPYPRNFTIYSKSGCRDCTKLKKLLREKQLFFFEIDCDEYLIEERETFLSFLEEKIGKKVSMFPIVFYDGQYLGGFHEATQKVEQILVLFDELF